MRKTAALLLSLIMVFSLLPPFQASAKDSVHEINNPVYTGELEDNPTAPLYSSGKVYTESSVIRKYKNKTYCSLGRELFIEARNQLIERKEKISLRVLSKEDLSDSFLASLTLLKKVMLGATEDELSVTTTDGDYLRWAISSYGISNIKKDAFKDGYYYFTVGVWFDYYDTAEQEKQVDKAVNSFVSSLDTYNMSDVEILRAVHDYICGKTSYCYAALDDPYSALYAFSPYGALVKGSCVCQGYAAAFYRICKELGFKVRFVSSDPDKGCHAWNIVELDGKYYFVDTTWDDEIIDEKKTEFDKYRFFLVDYQSIQKDDSFFYGAHKLYSALYDTTHFYDNYKRYFAETNYDFNDTSLLSSCTVSLSQSSYLYDGGAKTPAVTVKNRAGEVMTGGVEYTVSYSDNRNSGRASALVYAKGAYSGKTQRGFVITPPAANGLKITAVTESSVSLEWNAAASAPTGYAIERYENGEWKWAGSSKTNSATVSSLSPASKQTFRIKAYKSVGKRNYYGAYSNTAYSYTKPKKVAIKKPSAGKKKAVVKWKKVKCDGYIIEYSADKAMKKVKTAKAGRGATSKTVKKLKKGKKYYFRIRAYKEFKNASGKTVIKYGKRSAKKTVIIK